VFVRSRAPARAHTAGPAALPPSEAYRQAMQLTRLERYRESIPLFASALNGAPTDFWEIHYNYAAALVDLSLNYESREQHRVQSTASSVERVQLLAEAIRQLSLAAKLAPMGPSRALVLARRSNTFAVWGFPWESLISLRQAEQADPSQITLARQSDALLDMLIDPASGHYTRGARRPDLQPALPPTSRP
jgi:tetratricopeptide (TPR) repeat protein